MATFLRAGVPSISSLRPKTLAIHAVRAGRGNGYYSGVVRDSAFNLGTFEEAEEIFDTNRQGKFVYTRINNPTVDELERCVAVMESAEAGLATSSGMSAITLLMIYLAHGGHILTSNRVYGGVFHLFRDILPELGIKVTFVDNPHDLEEWKRKIRVDTKLLYLENPSNPQLDVFDIAAIAEVARGREIPLVVDNTLATSVLLQPLSLGATFVVLSLTKYPGAGLAVGGIILGSQESIDAMRGHWFRTMGPCMAPEIAATLIDHLSSLHERMLAHGDNASKVADFLAEHPRVACVHYPSIGARALRDRNRRLMHRGFGGLMAFDIHGGREEAKIVLEGLEIFKHMPNIGQPRSLVIHPATTTHGQLTEEERVSAGISQGMLRLSIGLEDPTDLIDDLRQALAKI